MASFRYTTGSYIRGQENWIFRSNPYVRAGSSIHCIGDDCRKEHSNMLYRYNEKQGNWTLLHLIPIISTIFVIVIGLVYLMAKRIREDRKRDEALITRMIENNAYVEEYYGQ